jgi:hypothetical protein
MQVCVRAPMFRFARLQRPFARRASSAGSPFFAPRPSGFEPLTYGSGGPRFPHSFVGKHANSGRLCPARFPSRGLPVMTTSLRRAILMS